MKPTTFHPDADAEVTEAAEYYESRSLGLRFRVARRGGESARPDFNESRGLPADWKASAPEVFVAVPLQSGLRGLPRSNSNRSIRSPEATSILLAKAPKGHRRARRPNQLNRTPGSPAALRGLLRGGAGQLNRSSRPQAVINKKLAF